MRYEQMIPRIMDIRAAKNGIVGRFYAVKCENRMDIAEIPQAHTHTHTAPHASDDETFIEK